MSRNTSRRHIVQSTILSSLYNWCPALEKQMCSQLHLRKKPKPLKRKNNTHNYWLKFQTSGGKQPKSKQNHSHTSSLDTHTSNSPSPDLVFRSPPRKQILKLQANTELNGAFNNYTIKKYVVRKILNDTQNIHWSCLPLNSNVPSYIKDTVADRKRMSLPVYFLVPLSPP